MTRNYNIGERVSFSSALCTVRYVGRVKGTDGQWIGVEWDDDSRGKHDGTRDGVRYFKCKVVARYHDTIMGHTDAFSGWSPSATAASFIRPTRYPDPERTFVEAVHHKYAIEDTNLSDAAAALTQEIIISGKVAEEVGFEKVRRQQAQLDELKIVIVDGLLIKSAAKAGESISDSCPSIVELDLSRNLLGNFEDVVSICEKLPKLKKLRLNGNRFFDLVASKGSPVPSARAKAFSNVTELEMNENLLPWSSFVMTRQYFPSLAALEVSNNQLHVLDDRHSLLASGNSLVSVTALTDHLKLVTMEYNSFNCLEDLRAMTLLPALETLRLKCNKISRFMTSNSRSLVSSLRFSPSVRYLDISDNLVDSWEFVDLLPESFPGLEDLRFSDNPIYERASRTWEQASRNDEGFMITIARLGRLRALNFSKVTQIERTNAELYYLSEVAKEIANSPEELELTIIASHPRFGELCESHGRPTVLRKHAGEVNPNHLEARLIKLNCYLLDEDIHLQQRRTIEVPKSCDVYRVKGLIGKSFELRPWKLRLMHETGDWDPIAGYEDDHIDSEDEDEDDRPITAERAAITEKGRWTKREVEIEGSTRQIGNFIDGLEATLRIEALD